MFREASVYALKRLSQEERAVYGLRVLTMHKWPRGVRRSDIDVWMPGAGPSIELLTAYHIKKHRLGGISHPLPGGSAEPEHLPRRDLRGWPAETRGFPLQVA
jgi:hypothetical protein